MSLLKHVQPYMDAIASGQNLNSEGCSADNKVQKVAMRSSAQDVNRNLAIAS